MGSETLKKQRERFFLDQFLEHQGIRPPRIEEGTPPAPDFLIDLEGRRVGIELTELHIRSKQETPPQQPVEPLPREVESAIDWIVNEAKNIYVKSEKPPVRVLINFLAGFRPDKTMHDWHAQCAKVATLIADQVQAMCVQTGQRVIWRSGEEPSEEYTLSKSVTVIDALGVPEHDMSHWKVVRPGWRVPLAGHLQDAINKKIPKIKDYKKAAGEIWLVIVSDLNRPSQLFSVPTDYHFDSVSTPFDRTIYYQYPDGEVFKVGR